MQIFILIVAVVGIARMARTRGASPWLFGTIGVVAFFAAPIVFGFVFGLMLGVLSSEGSYTGGIRLALVFLANITSFLGLGAVALWVRFIPGRQKHQPSMSWLCRECGWQNASYALECDACKAAFSERTIGTNQVETRSSPPLGS
jgi:hypothetical protein